MDTYNKQFIGVVILLLLLSTYNLIKINSYPEVFIDFLYHGVIIFVGLFLFYYFYIVSFVRDGTNNTFSELLHNDKIVTDAIKEVITDNLSPSEIQDVKNTLSNNINQINNEDILSNIEEENTTIFYRALTICIIFFVLSIIVTLYFKLYSTHKINITKIILINIYIFIIALSADYLIILLVSNNNIMPLSNTDILKTIFRRFEENFYGLYNNELEQ